MILISGTKSTKLAEEIAYGLDIRHEIAEIKRFPDGETYVRIHTDVSDEKCIVVHSALTDSDLIELFLILNSLKEHNAKHITCVLPYLAYTRQDKIFAPGEASSAKTILNVINNYSDHIITVNVHFFDVAGIQKFHNITIENIDAFPQLARYFSYVENAVIIAPDKGSLEHAMTAAKELNCDFDYLEKTRISGEEVEIKPKNMNVKNRNIIILDDIISTGGTIIEAAKLLRRQGAAKIYIGCIHGVFARGTDRFKNIVDEIICTNTIDGRFSKISVAPIIIDCLKKGKDFNYG